MPNFFAINYRGLAGSATTTAVTLITALTLSATEAREFCTLTGTVEDWAGSRLQGVSVVVYDSERSELANVLTNKQGQYKIERVPRDVDLHLEYKKIGYHRYPQIEIRRMTHPLTTVEVRLWREQASPDYYRKVADRLAKELRGEIDNLGELQLDQAEQRSLFAALESEQPSILAAVQHSLSPTDPITAMYYDTEVWETLGTDIDHQMEEMGTDIEQGVDEMEAEVEEPPTM